MERRAEEETEALEDSVEGRPAKEEEGLAAAEETAEA